MALQMQMQMQFKQITMIHQFSHIEKDCRKFTTTTDVVNDFFRSGVMSQSLPPRFPQPFLDLLAMHSSWRSVLVLSSVDRREAPMRTYWINEKSAVIELAIENRDELSSFLTRFPHCVRRATSGLFTAIVFFSGPGISRPYDQEVLDDAALRKSLRLNEGFSGGLILQDRCDSVGISDEFDYLTYCFLYELPQELRAGRDFVFVDRCGPSPESFFVNLQKNDCNMMAVTFDDTYGRILSAPVNAVLAALEGARLRFEAIKRLVENENDENENTNM
jgi:hypothetical protein